VTPDDVARLLAQWRATPTPALAERLEAASAAALEGFKAPKVTAVIDKNDPPYKRAQAPRDAFQTAWLGIAARGDVVATAWLASTLMSRIPYRGWAPNDQNNAFIERVRALRSRAPDPRIARALADVIVKDAANELGVPENLYSPVLELLAACGDARQAPVLERALASPQTKTVHVRVWLAKRLPSVIANLRAAGPAPEPMKEKREPAEGVALLAAIHEDPENDATRLVYADWLEGQGDPRSELISLQVREARGEATQEQSKRARELLRQHEDVWLGDLRPIFVNPLFTRGFLSAASLSQSWAVKGDAWARLQGDPRLATLEELRPGKCSAEIYLGFLGSTTCRSLARVAARDPKALAAIAKLGRRFAHLEMPLFLFLKSGAPYAVKSLGLTMGSADELGENLEATERRLPSELEGLAVRLVDASDADIDELLPDALTLWAERSWLIIDDGDERYVVRKEPRTLEVWARRSVDKELLERITKIRKRLKGVMRTRLVTGARVDPRKLKNIGVEQRLSKEIASILALYV
jgi:uncharacterized protein (TIGR02996 family)